MALDDVRELARRLIDGDRRALSRMITEVENETARGLEGLRFLYPFTGRARTIGLTGPGGSGKSTLTAVLARAYRARGQSVGVIAIDPSSPLTHGALLGDRIRMQDLTSDGGVFVRSMATRGANGGLTATASDVASVLDAAGTDVIIIETVGAGQDETDIAGVAQTTVVINTPGLGDAVQALKAGIMEVADVLVVNKGDLPGADSAVGQLQSLLSMAAPGQREIALVRVSALKEEGIEELIEAVDAHARYLEETGAGQKDRRGQVQRQIVIAAQAELSRRLRNVDRPTELESLTDAVLERQIDPRSAARRLMRQMD